MSTTILVNANLAYFVRDRAVDPTRTRSSSAPTNCGKQSHGLGGAKRIKVRAVLKSVVAAYTEIHLESGVFTDNLDLFLALQRLKLPGAYYTDLQTRMLHADIQTSKPK